MKTSTRTVILGAVVGLVLTALPARSEILGSLGLKAGAFLPNSDDKGLKDFNTGYEVAAEARISLLPLLAINPVVGYLASSYDKNGVSQTFRDIPIEVNLLLTAPIPKIDLFVGAGGSYHSANADASGGYSDSGSGTGYQVLAGLGHSLAVGSLFVEGEYSSNSIKFSKATENVNGGGITVFLGYKVGL